MTQKGDDSVIKVIFICYGNVCRSPMAEMMCNLYGKGKVVAESAGVHPFLPSIPALPSIIEVDQQTIDVMREIGIDISRHKPRHISSVNLSSFDILINMSPFSAKELLGFSRTLKGKIIKWNVVDPRGGSLRIYRGVRSDLEKKVLKMIEA